MDKDNNIPKHWHLKKLGEVCTYSKGKKPKSLKKEKTSKAATPYINIKAFEKGTYDEYTDGENCNLCNEGDLLMVWDGARCGLVGKARKGAVGSTLMKIEPKNSIHREFLFYFLQSKFHTLNTRPKGVGIPHIEPTLLWNFDLLLPSLPEQHAIVSKIEELFSELDKGKQQLETAQKQLKTYRQSLLKWAFEGEMTKTWRNRNKKSVSAIDFLKKVAQERKEIYNEKKKRKEKRIEIIHDFKFSQSDSIDTWAVATLDKLIYIAGRIGWRGLKKDEYTSKGAMFLSVHSLNFGKYVDYTKAFHITEERYLESPEIMLQEDDILLCKDGAGIGKIGIVKNLPRKATVNSSLLVIRGLEIFTPEFLYYLLKGPKLQNIVQSRISGSATPHLFQNDIRKFELLVPPLEEQQLIVQELESKLTVCDKLEETISQSLQQAETLRQSILKKAFEGKLVEFSEVEQAKEPKVIPLPTQEFPRTVPGIAATDLQAGIIAMVIEAHENHPKHTHKLSHVKCEKISDLVERKLGISLGRTAVKDAAGPDDYNHLKKVEHRAHKIGAFRTEALSIGHTYRPMRNLSKAIDKAKTALTENELKEVNALIETFLPFELEHAELVATLFAGWNNLLLLGQNPSDEEIVYESRENWSQRKLTIPREDFFKTMGWMKRHGYIPEGKGQLVLKKEKMNQRKIEKKK